MLPKLKINDRLVQKEQITSNAVQTDFIRTMLFKSRNQSYKKLKEFQCPKNAESPFGDFPLGMTTKNLKTTGKENANSLTYDPFADVTKKRTLSMPKTSSLRPRPLGVASQFRNLYDRGNIPIKVLHAGSTNKILWTIEPTKVDLKQLLPVFVDGLREKVDPYRLLAILGSFDIIEKNTSESLIEVIPLLIQPLKLALNTRDLDIMSVVCKFFIKLLTLHPEAGKHLVPYYRQLLPIFNIMRNCNKNLGDRIEYDQQKGLNLGDIMSQTLTLMEKTGGEDAFINIKYMIPTYESCIYI